MHSTPDPRPARRDDPAEPMVRPRGVPLARDREVLRLAVDDADGHPLPPPVTSSLDDTLVVVSTTTVAAVTPDIRERDATTSHRRVPRASTGFLDSNGADGPGWLAAQRAHSAGWLDSQRASSGGWLESLAARRRASHATGSLGWVDAQQRGVMASRALHALHDAVLAREATNDFRRNY